MNQERQSGHREEVVRTTDSVNYMRLSGFGNAWSSSLIWGRNHNALTQRNANLYLAETVYPLSRKNFLSGRAELVDKDELFPGDPKLGQRSFRTQPIPRVTPVMVSIRRAGRFIGGFGCRRRCSISTVNDAYAADAPVL